MVNVKKIFCATLLGAASFVSGAIEPESAIKITQAWARETPATAQVGGGFMRLHNSGSTADALIAVKTTVAASAELHSHTMDNGVMQMRAVPKIALPAGSTVTLQPGGLHVMLMELKAPLKKATSFTATLVFEKAAEQTVRFTVQPFAYQAAAAHAH